MLHVLVIAFIAVVLVNLLVLDLYVALAIGPGLRIVSQVLEGLVLRVVGDHVAADLDQALSRPVAASPPRGPVQPRVVLPRRRAADSAETPDSRA